MHLTEKLAEFVFEELSPAEMAEFRSHLSECPGCEEQLQQFQLTHAMLKASPDVEPPRQILFEFEKPRAMSWISRWLAPMAASAAIALAVVSFAPRPQPQIIERIVQQPVTVPAPPAPAPVAQPVNYQKILSELNELKRRDAAQAQEIQRVYGVIAYSEKKQHLAYRDTEERLAEIQMLAKNTQPR